MKRKLLSLLTIMLFLCITPLQAAETEQQDSIQFWKAKYDLLRKYRHSSGTERLKVLNELCAMHQQDLTFLYYEDLLFKEAKAQGNIEYQSISIYDRNLFYYLWDDTRHQEMWMKRMETFARQHNYYENYFKAKRLLIDSYTNEMRIALSLSEAKRMEKLAIETNHMEGYRESLICQANCYISSLRYGEGIQLNNKTVRLMEHITDPIDRLNAWLTITDIYNKVGAIEPLATSLDSLDVALDRALTIHPERLRAYYIVYLVSHLKHATVEIHHKHFDRAEHHLRQAYRYLIDGDHKAYFTDYYHILAYLKYVEGDYKQTLDYIQRALDCEYDEKRNIYFDKLKLKADALDRLGNSREASDIYKRMQLSKDSLYFILFSQQSDHIHRQYTAEHQKLEQERVHTRFNVFTILILSLFSIFIFVYIVRMMSSKKKMTENLSLVKNLTEIAEKHNEQKGHFMQNISFNIRTPLNNVVGFSQLLAKEMNTLSKDEIEEYSRIIRENSDRLIDIVNDILDLSRLEAGMTKWNLTNLQAGEWGDTMANLVRTKTDRQADFTLHIDEDARTKVMHIDAARLNKFVLRLLTFRYRQAPYRASLTVTYDRESDALLLRFFNELITNGKEITNQEYILFDIVRLLFKHFGGEEALIDLQTGTVSSRITLSYSK